MRAELIVSHDGANMLSLLERLYGPSDSAALRSSMLWHKAPSSAASIDYAARKVGLILMASFIGKDLELYVESSGGRLREGVARVWRVLSEEAKDFKPELVRLVLFDEDSSDVITEAARGIGANLRREDLFIPIATGIVSALVLLIVRVLGHPSADFYYGSATALGVAILSVVRLALPWRTKELVWR
jgi:hypothetical protein